MKRILSIITLIVVVGCGYKGQDKVAKNDSVVGQNVYLQGNKKNASPVELDSTATHQGVFDYILSLHLKDTIDTVYRIQNHDNSVEMAKKYSITSGQYAYDCFEIADLPTGLTWNIFYDKRDTVFYITDKYDVQALGDTIERNSINFKLKTATVVSPVNETRYKVNLTKIWPK